MIRSTIAVAVLATATTALAAESECAQCKVWNAEQAPFQIFGNTYFVGPHGLSAVLITSPQGHILIDGALPESAARIEENIQKLGFKISDVKVILNSHVHFDHAGGIAELQKRSNAKVIASDLAAEVLTTGKVTPMDPQFGHLDPMTPTANVQKLGQQREVVVGSLKLGVIHTPGHTPGGTTWTWQSCESDRCLNMVYGDSLNAISDTTFKYSGDSRYPNARKDMQASIAAIAGARCDILIAAHPEANGLWNVIDVQGRGDRTKLVDSTACKRYAAAADDRFRKRLESEAKK